MNKTNKLPQTTFVNIPLNTTPVVILQAGCTLQGDAHSTPTYNQLISQGLCSMHILAAVALSELASGPHQLIPVISSPSSNENKKEAATQTEQTNPADLWLNFVQNESITDVKVNTSHQIEKISPNYTIVSKSSLCSSFTGTD